MRPLKQIIEMLSAHAQEKRGVYVTGEARLSVPLNPGDRLMLVRLTPTGSHDVLLPATLAHRIGFGDVLAGFYIIPDSASNLPGGDV